MNSDLNMVEVDRERIVKFGRGRAKEGAGPVTLSMDIGAIKLVIQHATAVHGIPVKVEPVHLGRVALKRLGLIGKSNKRDRRPSPPLVTNATIGISRLRQAAAMNRFKDSVRRFPKSFRDFLHWHENQCIHMITNDFSR